MRNPIANPGQFAAEAAVRAMWSDSQIQRARGLVARMFSEGFGDSTPDEARPAFDQAMDEFLTNYMFKAAASDSQHPRFVRTFMPPHHWYGRDVPGSRMGGDNPDNCYRLAGVEQGARYRITGRTTGTAPSTTSFTLTGNYGTTDTIQTLETRHLHREGDGSFVITIDADPAAGRPNHLTTAPHVKFLFVRDTMGDWGQTPYDLSVERLDRPTAPPLAVDVMAGRAAQHVVEDVPLYYWYQRRYTSRRPNVMIAQPHAAIGGLVTQQAGRAYLQLAADEAAIVEIHPAQAGYAAAQLTDWWWRSIDCAERTSSLTASQSQVNADGRIRWVAAGRDPGVANWLDTAGLSHVLMVLRWQDLPNQFQPPAVGLSVVKLAQLRSTLPVDTVWMDPGQRAAQLEERRAAYARRF